MGAFFDEFQHGTLIRNLVQQSALYNYRVQAAVNYSQRQLMAQ